MTTVQTAWRVLHYVQYVQLEVKEGQPHKAKNKQNKGKDHWKTIN